MLSVLGERKTRALMCSQIGPPHSEKTRILRSTFRPVPPAARGRSHLHVQWMGEPAPPPPHPPRG
eukprot:scaffold3581_cov417-Prasinococcus_capsulatus_cf.AAC.10